MKSKKTTDRSFTVLIKTRFLKIIKKSKEKNSWFVYKKITIGGIYNLENKLVEKLDDLNISDTNLLLSKDIKLSLDDITIKRIEKLVSKKNWLL